MPLPRALHAGDRIERYELVHPIARGGMGSVWAARLHGTPGFEKMVAIKTVLPHLASDQRVRAMFLDEARLASAVSHRNVAQILDFLECDGALYLVMEWVDGAPLKNLSDALAEQNERIHPGVLLRVLADVCAGLHAAHELRDATGAACELVHRDVSPHNILVGIDGNAKLIDFGVAKARHRASQETTFGALKGKLHFMSPEQARGDVVDRRSDVWSVGAVMFYMLAGHGPFELGERTDTLRLLLSGTPALPLPEDVHPAIARIISGCLAYRPQDRFHTAEELGMAIEIAIEEMGLTTNAADVAEFMKEYAGISVSGERVKSGARQPLSLNFSRDDEHGEMSGVRSTSMRTRRWLVGIAAAAVGILPAVTYTLLRPAPVEPAGIVELAHSGRTLEVTRDELLEPAAIALELDPIAAPTARRGSTVHGRPAAAVRAPRGAAVKARSAAPASAAPSVKRSDDFGTAVETRK